MTNTGTVLGPDERWEQGIDHDPRSERLVRAMGKIDFEVGGDHLQIKMGGDGDNGEHMMYLLDCHFAEIDSDKTVAEPKDLNTERLDELYQGCAYCEGQVDDANCTCLGPDELRAVITKLRDAEARAAKFETAFRATHQCDTDECGTGCAYD